MKTKLHKGSILHKDNFAPRVSGAQVTILHGGSFLHMSKIYIYVYLSNYIKTIIYTAVSHKKCKISCDGQ